VADQRHPQNLITTRADSSHNIKEIAMNQFEDDDSESSSGILIMKPNPHASDMERAIDSWLAARHEMLWIPIIEVGFGRQAVAKAKERAANIGGSRLIVDVLGFYRLPIGVRGWLFPAHLDDTDVVCTRVDREEVVFGPMIHPITQQRVTWRTPTAGGIRWL
jgi:hypothetical protein